MGRFQVPSPSPPSTLGSRRSTRSPSTSPIYTNGPNTFTVPSSHGTPSTSSERESHSPSGSLQNPRSMPGALQASPSPPGSLESNRTKRSRSPSPSPEMPTPRRRKLNFWTPRLTAQQGEEERESLVMPTSGRRNFNLRPPRPITRRRHDGEAKVFFSGGRETTPVPEVASYDVPRVPSSSASSSDSSSEGSEHGHGGGGGNDGPPDTLADHTDSDLDAQGLWMPLVGHQPERLPGRFGAAQPFPTRHLTLLKERPGRLPTHTARSPTSPGLDWGDGAAWWYPAEGSAGTANIVREIFAPTGFKVIEQEVAQETAELMYHENLINMLDGDGFGSEQEEIRPEVLYEFCAGGTLNRLILSRRPKAPVYGAEAPVVRPRSEATYLPTREVVLGLPEDLVWHVLLSLLRATYWLHHRRQPVVHCAIDPANVFFTAPKPGDQRPLVKRYGLVKLGGFSKAVILPHRLDPDRNDHEEIEDRCQMFETFIEESYEETGYEAPELLGMLGEDDIKEERIVPGPCSDLFSIGATCFAMMTGKTIWDVLLERRFISRSLTPQRVDRARLHEKWRFHSHEERMDLLEPILRGEAILVSALPEFYSVELRQLVEGLLSLDPDMRGESASVVDEAEEAFAEKCDVGNGPKQMRRLWKRITRKLDGRKELEKAIREWEEVFGPEMGRVVRRNAGRLLAPLEP